MSIHLLEREQLVPRPVDEVFACFAQAHARSAASISVGRPSLGCWPLAWRP
jgi:hypothetical protein